MLIQWNGCFRVHEIISKTVSEFDPQTTLLWEDVKFSSSLNWGKLVKAMAFRIKSPKVDRVGAGDYVEVYATGEYNCLVKAILRTGRQENLINWDK